MFKHTLCILLSITLVACATNVATPVIVAPTKSAEKELMSVKKITLVDQRSNPALAIVNGTNMPVNKELIPTLNNWLNDAIGTSRYGSKEMTVSLVSYASYVKQESFSFNLESVIEWRVKVESKNSTWTKSYQTTMNEEGPLKADNSIIEKHLNKIAEKLLDRTLSDPEFEKAVFN